MGTPKKEDGYTLIEVLIALTIFAIALLAVVGMQTSAIRMNSAAGKLTNLSTWAMDKIEEGSVSTDAVLNNAKEVLIKLCTEFDAHKQAIGEGLASALQSTEKEQRTLCKCPNCGKGDMTVIRSKKTKKRFLACNEYPNCKTTWGLPQAGLRVSPQQRSRLVSGLRGGVPQLRATGRGDDHRRRR